MEILKVKVKVKIESVNIHAPEWLNLRLHGYKNAELPALQGLAL
jgi:hypothetical protein